MKVPKLLLVFLTLSGIAVSGLPASGGTPSPATGSGVAPDLLHDARVASAQLGIPVDAVVRQLQLQDAVGRVDQLAQQTWPDEYAGLWVEPHDGGRVVVAFTGGTAAKLEQLGRGFPRPDLLRGVTAVRPHRALLTLQRRMIADRELAKAGRLAFAGVSGGGYDLDVDVRRNAVVVSAPAVTTATVAAFRSRYGSDVLVEGGALPVNASCVRTNCRHTMRSGLEINGTGGTCSTAFAGFNNRIYTAAHCNDVSKHGGSTYGSQIRTQYSGDVDAQLLELNSSFYAGAWIWISGSTQARPVTSASSYIAFPVGATICKSGRTTNETCGTVSSKTYSPSIVPSSFNFIKTNMCVQKGDSGGGVYSSNQAVGIVSGAAGDGNGNVLPCTDTNYFSYFGHISNASATFTTTVKTSESSPSFSSVSGAARLGTTLQANFSKPILCSSVSSTHWRVTNVTSVTVTGAACAAVSPTGSTQESNYRVVLTLGRALQPGTTVSVSLVTAETDIAGNQTTVPTVQTTTVPL